MPLAPPLVRDVDSTLNLEFALEFGKVVQLVDHAPDTVAPSGNALGLDDFTVEAFDDLQRSLGTLSLSTYITTDDGGIDPLTTDDEPASGFSASSNTLL